MLWHSQRLSLAKRKPPLEREADPVLLMLTTFAGLLLTQPIELEVGDEEQYTAHGRTRPKSTSQMGGREEQEHTGDGNSSTAIQPAGLQLPLF